MAKPVPSKPTLTPKPKARPRPKKPKAFRLLDLPAEIRLRIYEVVLRVDRTIDLGAYNHHTVAPLLNVFASRQLYAEAWRVFYSVNTFRIFSTDGKFIHTKKPLLSRFPATYRSVITTIELRLGPGWTKPPKNWVLKPSYGLKDCTSLRLLKIFVELDPADSPICVEWMSTRTSYTDYSVCQLVELLHAIPTIAEVRFDGFPSVRKTGPLVKELQAICVAKGLKISYGPYREWALEKEPEPVACAVEVESLATGLSHLQLGLPAF